MDKRLCAAAALLAILLLTTCSLRAEVLPHPAGCPRIKFCGCGASVKVFGHPVLDLYRAAAWYRFQRAAAAPGRVAVRQHHVMVLEAHISGLDWQVYDANSGGHATRRHVRSIAGYVVVDPYARAAQ